METASAKPAGAQDFELFMQVVRLGVGGVDVKEKASAKPAGAHDFELLMQVVRVGMGEVTVY